MWGSFQLLTWWQEVTEKTSRGKEAYPPYSVILKLRSNEGEQKKTRRGQFILAVRPRTLKIRRTGIIGHSLAKGKKKTVDEGGEGTGTGGNRWKR